MIRIALLALTIPGSAIAQQDTARYRLRPVEVTVTRSITSDIRTAAAVTVVGASEIQRGQPTVGLDESLAVVPGVTINNRYNLALGSRIAVRGLGARAAFGVRGVRVLMDGVPLTMPDGQANLNNVDLGSTGRIEVLRGPASSLYGNAAGGVISIESEAAPSGGFVVDARSVFGDVGRDDLTRLTKHQVKAGGGQESFDYLLSLARLDTDGFRAHSRAEQTNVNARVRFGTTTRWQAVFNHADAPVAQNPGSLPRDSAELKPEMAWPRNVATGAGESARQTQLGLGVERGTRLGGFQANIYGLTRSLENPLPFGYIVLDRTAGGARASISNTARAFARDLHLVAGADVELQRDDRQEFDNVNGSQGTQRRRDQQDRVTSIGPFAQARFNPLARLELTAGVRYDWVAFETEDHLTSDGRDDSGDRTLQAFSPRLAALYALSEASSLYVSVSTSFQTPTTTELINRPPLPGQTTPGGFNEDLEPQRALNYELGIKGNLSSTVRYELVGFHMKVKDALVPFLVSGDGREFFRNAGETKQRGLEAALGFVPRAWAAIDVAYTLSDFTFVDDGNPATAFEDNEIPGVAPHHFFGRLRLRPHRAITVELEHDYTSSYFTDDLNSASNDAASITDARVILETQFKQLRLSPFVALNNITNAQYNSSVVINAAGARFFEPAPGRNLYIGMSVGFTR